LIWFHFVEAGLLTALTAIQFRAEPGTMFLHLTILLRKLVDEVSADSGLQLDLEIALSVVSAKVQPHELFSPAEDCVETSGDVIEIVLRVCPANVELFYACRA
jgi:hypothetical protein